MSLENIDKVTPHPNGKDTEIIPKPMINHHGSMTRAL